MVIDDLLWWDNVSALGLPPGLCGTLQGSDVLLECEVVDVRVYGVLNSVGIIFNGNGLIATSDWGHLFNVAVLVVRGVVKLESPAIRDYIGSWDVILDEERWMCRIGQVHTPGQVAIWGCGASLYFGQVPGLPDPQPFLGDFDTAAIRGGWPTWGSEFEVTVEPEHANPHLVGGYVHGLLSGGRLAGVGGGRCDY